MRLNLSAILGRLIGGAFAGATCWYAVGHLLPSSASLDYTPRQLGAAASAVAVSGVLGVLVGWLVHRRRWKGLGGIAAIVSLLGAAATAASWVGSVSAGAGTVLLGAVLAFGGSLILLAAVCGLVAALLKPGYDRRQAEAAQ